MKTQVCRCCNKRKEMTAFHLSPSSKFGRTKDCKKCIAKNRPSRAIPEVATEHQRKKFWIYGVHPLLGYRYSNKVVDF